MQGAEGYINCVNTLNKVCGVYNNPDLAEETRSITIEDINRALGGVTVTYPEEGAPGSGTVTLNTDSKKTNIGETTEYPSYTYQSGDYSPESYPNEVSSQIGTKVQANAYRYDITNEGGLNYSYLQSLGTTINERGYNMLFEGTTRDDGYTKSYWLASSGIAANSYDAWNGSGNVSIGSVDFNMKEPIFCSAGREFWNNYAVRPLVTLKSSVTVNDVHKIADQTEEEWKMAEKDPGSGGFPE